MRLEVFTLIGVPLVGGDPSKCSVVQFLHETHGGYQRQVE
jgi:hypothetical protein